MNAPIPAGVLDAEQTLTTYERMRLEMAATIAAGMLSNPNIYRSNGWQSSVPRDSMQIVDNIFRMHFSGGY